MDGHKAQKFPEGRDALRSTGAVIVEGRGRATRYHAAARRDPATPHERPRSDPCIGGNCNMSCWRSVADRISFVSGEASGFELEYGYCAQGVTSLTPTFAPQGRRRRALPITVGEITGWCMAPHDPVLSKLGAGRGKDLDFARSAAAARLVRRDELVRRLEDVTCSEEHRRWIAARIDTLFG